MPLVAATLARVGLTGAQLSPVRNPNVVASVKLPGVSGNYVSTPNAAPLQITSNITIDVSVGLASWATTPGIMTSKWNTSNFSYEFYNASDILQFYWTTDGSSATHISATTTTGIANNTPYWVRISFQVNDGAGHNVGKFYKSPDGSVWTQVGSTVTTAGATSIFNGTADVEVGADRAGTSNVLAGSFYEVKIYNSALDSSSGTPVFDGQMSHKPWGATSWLDSSITAAPITLHGTKWTDSAT